MPRLPPVTSAALPLIPRSMNAPWRIDPAPIMVQNRTGTNGGGVMRVGFIGLGQMGRGMARRLLDAGHDLIAWNRSPDPCQALRDQGATIATRIEHTLEAEIVVSMLADDASVQAVWIEQGLLERLPP